MAVLHDNNNLTSNNLAYKNPSFHFLQGLVYFLHRLAFLIDIPLYCTLINNIKTVNCMKIRIQFISICFLVLMAISCQHSEVLSPSNSNTTNTTNSDNDPDFSQTEITASRPELTNLNEKPTPVNKVCQVRLQGTWTLSEVLDNEGNATTCAMIYAHLPDTLKFTYEDNIRLDWVDATGFHLLDHTPNVPHECYHAMYKVNCTDYLLDIGNLYCSDPSPVAARCGPPQYGRFKIIRTSPDTMILESYQAGWSTVDYYAIPNDYVQRYVFEKL